MVLNAMAINMITLPWHKLPQFLIKKISWSPSGLFHKGPLGDIIDGNACFVRGN